MNNATRQVEYSQTRNISRFEVKMRTKVSIKIPQLFVQCFMSKDNILLRYG